MRHVILAAAAAVMLSGSVSAHEPATEIAMGPTSAAHFPINQPRGNPSPDCSPPYDHQCPKAHGTPKYWHKSPKHRRHKHSQDK
jgi:hypothetical protein